MMLRISIAILVGLVMGGSGFAAEPAVTFTAIPERDAAREGFALMVARPRLEEAPRAQRNVARALLTGAGGSPCASRPCREQAVSLLLEAARAGDTTALLMLDEMQLTADPAAPPVDAIVAIERARAETGDAVMAWRLARRYLNDETDAIDEQLYVNALNVAATADGARFPYAREAAFRLCEAHAAGAGVAIDLNVAAQWCRRAAIDGHAGAAISLARLRQADD